MADRAERLQYLQGVEAQRTREVLDAIAPKRDDYRQLVEAFVRAEVSWLQAPLDKAARDAADEARKQLSAARGALTQTINAQRDSMEADLDDEFSAIAKPDWTAPEAAVTVEEGIATTEGVRG